MGPGGCSPHPGTRPRNRNAPSPRRTPTSRNPTPAARYAKALCPRPAQTRELPDFHGANSRAAVIDGTGRRLASSRRFAFLPPEITHDGHPSPRGSFLALRRCSLPPCDLVDHVGGRRVRRPARMPTRIAGGTARFAQAKMKALQKCEDGDREGQRGDVSGRQSRRQIAKAGFKLRRVIGKVCGGSDANCGTGTDDETLASIGWDLGTCPNVASGTCQSPLVDCGDVVDCVQCGSDACRRSDDRARVRRLEPHQLRPRRSSAASARSARRHRPSSTARARRCNVARMG